MKFIKELDLMRELMSPVEKSIFDKGNKDELPTDF